MIGQFSPAASVASGTYGQMARNNAMPPPELPRVSGLLDQYSADLCLARDRVAAMSDRLENVMNRAFGAEPEPLPSASGPAAENSTQVGAIAALAGSLNFCLDRLEMQIARVERI